MCPTPDHDGPGPAEADRHRKAAMETAVRLLARREHTGRELRRKLRRRGISGELSGRVIAECERLGYVDDRRTADLYLGELLRKGYGSLHIRRALKEKGISAAAIGELLSRRLPAEREMECARRALAKKRRLYDREPDRRKRRQKAYRFLVSRGFPAAVAGEILNGETDDPSEW